MLWALMPGDYNVSYGFCHQCAGHAYGVHPEIAALISNTVAETGRAANALSTFVTNLFMGVYYGYLGDMAVVHNATVVTTTRVQTPGPYSSNGCPGYIAVSTLLLSHVVCVVVITALYVAQVRYSRYGNVWHTIAQLRGDGLDSVLDEAHDASDETVENSLRARCEDDILKVGRQNGSGRVGVIED